MQSLHCLHHSTLSSLHSLHFYNPCILYNIYTVPGKYSLKDYLQVYLENISRTFKLSYRIPFVVSFTIEFYFWIFFLCEKRIYFQYFHQHITSSTLIFFAVLGNIDWAPFFPNLRCVLWKILGKKYLFIRCISKLFISI